MSLSAKLRRAPLRAVTGAYILNSGVTKLGADDESAKNMHGMASGAYGFLGKVQPRTFAKGWAVGEIAVGSALLLPVVPPLVAGAALAGFSGALLNLYWHTPGMHQENDPRPTAAGTGYAKDVWMFGIGTSLVVDSLLEPVHNKRLELTATAAEKRSARMRWAKRKAAKSTKRATTVTGAAKGAVSEAQAEIVERALKASERAQQASEHAAERAEKAQQRSAKTAEGVAKRLTELRSEYGPVVAEKAKHARDTARTLTGEYAPMVAEKAKQARDAAQDAAARAKERVAS